MRPRARTLAAFAIIAMGLLLYGCPDKTARIGVVLPLSGSDQIYGESVKRGVEVAYAEIQADTSRATPIEIEIVDSESDVEIAKKRVDEQYGAGAIAVIGGVTSDEVKSVIEVVDRYDRVILSPSASNPELTDISTNFYRICPSDFSAATRMADFAYRTLNLKSAVIVVERTYGMGIQSVFEESFQNFGGEVLDVIEVPAGSDYGGIAERIVTVKPEAVYLAAFAPTTGAMIKELRKQDFQGRILTTSAFTPSAIEEVGLDAKDVVLTRIYFELDSDHAHVKKFVQGYEEVYEGEKPDLYAAYGYDAMRVLAAAIEGRPALAQEMHKGLRDSVKDFPGVTGSILFDEKGDVKKFPRVYLIGEDLALDDYTERIERRQEEIRRRKEELQKRLEQLHNQSGDG